VAKKRFSWEKVKGGGGWGDINGKAVGRKYKQPKWTVSFGAKPLLGGEKRSLGRKRLDWGVRGKGEVMKELACTQESSTGKGTYAEDLNWMGEKGRKLW